MQLNTPTRASSQLGVALIVWTCRVHSASMEWSGGDTLGHGLGRTSSTAHRRVQVCLGVQHSSLAWFMPRCQNSSQTLDTCLEEARRAPHGGVVSGGRVSLNLQQLQLREEGWRADSWWTGERAVLARMETRSHDATSRERRWDRLCISWIAVHGQLSFADRAVPRRLLFFEPSFEP